MAAMTAIDVTPLLDLAFSLLIIFMISTPLLEQTIPINLPLESVKPQQSNDDEDFKAIAIDKDGQIFWGKQEVSIDELSDILAKEALKVKQPVLNVRADANLPYKHVIEVIDVIKTNNLKKISLDTQAK